ncbi:MAG: toll/interleukin-1 receptor domain-containing protein [Pseudomonadota bacterium]
MKVSERLTTIQLISREIQSRYNWGEATTFIRAFCENPHTYADDYESVSEMMSYNLGEVQPSVLGEIVDDLGLDAIGHISASIQPPKVWSETDKFRVFISHISEDKDRAHRLREALSAYNVSSFVAHDNIEPTLDWQVQIERALHSMDAFVSIHTKGYSKSFWCQQETGFAFGNQTKVIALRMGEDPTGFASKHQAISRGTKRAEDVAAEIEKLLRADDRTKAKFEACQPKATAYDDLDDDIPF